MFFSDGYMSAFFEYTFMAMILLSLVVSLTTPVDRGVAAFKVLMIVFGLLVLST